MSYIVDIKADKPTPASALPVSDKPVTLSFKGALGQKTGLTASTSGGSVKKAAAPATLGFSMNDEEAEEGNGKASGEDENKAPADLLTADDDDDVIF